MTTETQPLPTDAEAYALWLSTPITGAIALTAGAFARAVLAKWGTPAPVGVESVAKFDNPMVQAVYAILCEDASPPSGEHWEGFVARRIVDQVLAMGRVPPETCEWTATDAFDQTYWDSACGEAWTFIDGDPADNSVRFCQGCGKPVHIKQGGQHGTE